MSYKCALNGLIDFNVERFCEAGSVKLVTTFVGRVLPLSGKGIHTRGSEWNVGIVE